MWRLLVAKTKNYLQNARKSSRVGDETTMYEAGGGDDQNARIVELPMLERGGRSRANNGGGWNGLSFLYSVLHAPISILSCISHPPDHFNGYDGVWVSGGEFANSSEMNHLMVNDSMRYAILL
ncbi:Zinc finger and BTB domain-containing protein [Quillaja saponaria]|uniref:Zinc finger and BTB domain-containing protein n=1 Tax=Quillaja saponaria TaxID=32244 RepID=A0AAD7LP78_QUISA|nr:Zinc finger and BTB domain-containing protein [Quillaja saponaria]